MGRKIPGRKHHGVRDPAKQREEREKKIAHKINAPPNPKDDQSFPNSLKRLNVLRKETQEGKFKKKKILKRRKKNSKPKPIDSRKFEDRDEEPVPGMSVPLIPTPKFVQRSDEPDWHFLHRISKETHNLIRETQFEEKFGVEFVRDSKGLVQGVEKNQKKDPVLEFIEKEDMEKKKKTKKVDENPMKKLLSQKQRKKMAKAKRRETKQETKQHDFGHLQDSVKFGEVAAAPPALKLPKKATSDNKLRPGTKPLLLNTLLNEKLQLPERTIKTTQKRPDQQYKEKQRLQAVEAYRKLKAVRKNLKL